MTLFVKRFFGGNIWEQMCYWMHYSSYIHVMLNNQHKTESEQFSKEWWYSFTEMFSGTPVLSRMRLEAFFPPLYYFGLTTLTTLTVIYHLAPSDQSGWGSVFFFSAGLMDLVPLGSSANERLTNSQHTWSASMQAHDFDLYQRLFPFLSTLES